MPDLVDEILYLNARIERDFSEAVLTTPAPYRDDRWYGEWSLREIVLHLATWDEMDARYLHAVAQGDADARHRWSGPAETDALNASLIAEHAGQDWDGAIAYASTALDQLHAAIEALRILPPDSFWERGSLLRYRALHSATHRTHHLLPVIEWRESRGLGHS